MHRPVFACTVVVGLVLIASPGAAQTPGPGAAQTPGNTQLVGTWLGLQAGAEFPLGCASGDAVRYSSDGTVTGGLARGTWKLQGDQIVEAMEADADTGVEAAVNTSRIEWKGPDTFVKTFADRTRMTFRRCPPAALAATPAKPARSKAAEFLVREQISEACEGKPGKIDPASVIERDLTGDGNDDLIISHQGIACADRGQSGFCGAQLCTVNIYVRRGALLKLEREMLGVNVSVIDGRLPVIRMHGHGGRAVRLRWNGRTFR